MPRFVTRDPSLALAIAMISAPRPRRTVEQSIANLRRAGFHQPIHVFQEPGTNVSSQAGIEVFTHATRLGMWRNWRSAAHAMLQTTTAPYILICEDDINLSGCAAAALHHAMATLSYESWGYASLFTPLYNVEGRTVSVGWQAADAPRGLWGSLAYCFTRTSLHQLVMSERVRRHPFADRTDTLVSRAIWELGRRRYLHVPSLCDHAGVGNSSVGHILRSDHRAVGFSITYAEYIFDGALSHADAPHAMPSRSNH